MRRYYDDAFYGVAESVRLTVGIAVGNRIKRGYRLCWNISIISRFGLTLSLWL